MKAYARKTRSVRAKPWSRTDVGGRCRSICSVRMLNTLQMTPPTQMVPDITTFTANEKAANTAPSPVDVRSQDEVDGTSVGSSISQFIVG